MYNTLYAFPNWNIDCLVKDCTGMIGQVEILESHLLIKPTTRIDDSADFHEFLEILEIHLRIKPNIC